MNSTWEDTTMCSLAGLPSPGSNVTVLVTRVNSNPLCPMVEFWGNFSEEKRHIYEQMRKDIQCYGETFQEREGNPGDQCLVQICETWYRARVVSHVSSNYSVFLFDEGKTLNVKTNMLAWGKKEHFLPPPEVELCVLANVLPLSSENKWSPMALEFLRSLCGKMVNAHVEEVFMPHRAFLLDIPSLSRQILEMGFAKKLPPERFREFVFHYLQPSSSDLPTKPQASSQSTSDKSTEVRHPDTQLNYMYPELQPEMVETVVVTEVTNPSRIFCQLKVFSQELMKLTEQITKHYEGRVRMCPPPKILGTPCAARGPDGKWYRAVLQQVIVSSNVAEVLQVDYGKKHFTQIDNIRQLAAEFFRMPVVTYVCSLHGVIDKGVGWTVSQIDYLKSLLLHKTLISKFEYQSLSEGVHYITLIGAGSRNLNKEFGTHADCLLESEKIHVDYSMNKGTSQRLCPPNHAEEMEWKSNVPQASLLVNTTHKAVVQYVESPSEFWVQTQKYADEFDQMMDDLTELYSNPASAEIVKSPTIGLHCAALSKDGCYYRANVCEVNGKQLMVYFVDYGNTEAVDSHSIRHLPSKYQMLPPLALKCALAGIRPVCDGWSVKALNCFTDLIMDKVLDLHVVGKIQDMHVVQLSDPTLDGEKDLCHQMCTAGLARKEEAITKPVTKYVQRPQSLPQVPQRVDSESKSETSSGSGTALPKASRSVFKEYLFQIGSSLEVFVSHIDSPNDFWCQIYRNVGHLKLLMQDIQTHYADSEYQELTEAVCVARHPKNGIWYRALVIHKHQTPHVDVLCVDYGQTRKVALQDLRPINPSFLKLNGQAFRCRLYNLIHPLSHTSHEWDSNALHLFKEFVEEASSMNITLKCTIYAVMYDMQKVVFNVVDLETPFQSVCNLLVNRGLAQSALPKNAPVPPFRLDTYYYSNHNLKMGSEEKVIVTTVKSVNRFYCQLSRNSEVIQNLVDKVNFLCHQLESVQCPKTFGTVCFAKYIDGEWYRGQIKATNPSIVINFVDYGDTIEVQKADLLPIPIEAGEIMSVPVQAIECGLSDISVDIPSEVNAWFEKYVIDHVLKAVIVAKEPNGKLLIELYDGKTQVNCLLKEKFATEMQRKRLDSALEQDTKVCQNAVGMDITRFESKAQVEDDWRKRHTESTFYRDIEDRNASKLVSKPQANDVCQKQHYSTHIPFKRGDATKFQSKAPVDDTQAPFNRGDGRNQGCLYSRPQVDVCKKQDPSLKPSLFGSGNGENKTRMEPERTSFNGGSRSAESRVRSNSPAKHNVPETCPAQPIEISAVVSSKITAPQVLPKLSDLPQKSIKPGTESDVYVSHCNSPSSFFVQLVSDEEEIFSLVEKLNNDQDIVPLSVKDIQQGNLVNALFPEDQSWYRAVIKSEFGNDSYNVEFIDFGNMARVSSSKICRLAKSYLGHPRLSIHCFLSGSKTSEGYSNDLKNEIDGTDGAIHCTFIQERNNVWEVTLGNGDRLGDDLQSRDSTVTSDALAGKEVSLNQGNSSSESATHTLAEVVVLYKKMNLSEGQPLDVFASTINGPEFFWCHYPDKLQEISDRAQHVGNAPDLKSANMGSLHAGNACLALFADDEQWYRGEVLSKEGDVLCVLFVDYGNESYINVGKVRELPHELQDIPPQAFLCQLDGFDGSHGSWKEDAADHFFDLLNDKPLKVTVVKPTQVDNGRISYIVKVEYQDQFVNDLMKGYWCPSSGNGEVPETLEPAAEPAALQSTLLASELETFESSSQEPLPCDIDCLPQEVTKLDKQDDKKEFSETKEEALPALPAENLGEHMVEEALEKDLVAAASSSNQGELVMTENEHFIKNVVQKVINNVVTVINLAETSEDKESDKCACSALFVLEQDLNEDTRILCIDESYESIASCDLDADGKTNIQACEEKTTAANPEFEENALVEEDGGELFESDFGKLRRITGIPSVGEECIVWSQSIQNWCHAKVLSISKETFLVLLLEQDSQMTVDPQNIFKAIPEEKTQNAQVDTHSPLSDDLTQVRSADTEVKTDVQADPLECVSYGKDQPEEIQSDETASLDDGRIEEPSSTEGKPESFAVRTDLAQSAQQEEDALHECQVDVEGLVDMSEAPEVTSSVLEELDAQHSVPLSRQEEELYECQPDVEAIFDVSDASNDVTGEQPSSIEMGLRSSDVQMGSYSLPSSQQEPDLMHECQSDKETISETAEELHFIEEGLEANGVQTDLLPSFQEEDDLCEFQADVDATAEVSATADLDEDPNIATHAVDPPAAEEQIEECLSAEDAPDEVDPLATAETPLEEPEIPAVREQEQHQENVLCADLHGSTSEEVVPLQEIKTECSPAEETGSSVQKPELQGKGIMLLQLLDFSPEKKVEDDGYHDDQTEDTNCTEKSDESPAEVDLIDLTSDTEDSDTASDDTVKDVSEEAEGKRADEGQTLEEVLSEVTHLSLRAESVSGDDSDNSVIFVAELKAPLP